MLKMTSSRLGAALAAVAAMTPALVLAHAGEGLPHDHGLSAGFVHPFTGLDHLAAMLAVGLWSALTHQGRRMVAAPLAFAGWLLMGALLGAWMSAAGGSLPGVEPMVAASVLVLGLVAAARWKLGASASAALVSAFAVFHGLAHGSELQGASALAGMVAATVVLHALGLSAGLWLRTLAPLWSRMAGASLALVGLGLLTRMVWA
ncbi:urease accessory protein [Roseateles sp. YR242]|uniref:HupE/UreJ family protein n=1 Tax=Roseateles sp. YR242 TaxID=1855305 RepID=UPI0008BCEBCD|nr:HupE/UreJ family protein [Roseateles sp. YR242]SEK40956.1 urease accessory protein [Roseateles sp. YR242]